VTKWKRQIRIKQFLTDSPADWEPVRDAIVEELRRQPEYGPKLAAIDNEFVELVDEMEDADGCSYLDACLDALYDWADDNKVWIGGEFKSSLPSV
jgi:hypothetical protein